MSQEIAQLVPELDRCNRCGFCLDACPTYRISQDEWMVTRGRVALVEAAAQGQLAVDGGLEEAVQTCLLCRACVDHCPPHIEIDYLMTRARADINQLKPLPRLESLLYRKVLPNRKLLERGAKLVSIVEKAGLRQLAYKLGFLKGKLKQAHLAGPSIPGKTAMQLIKPYLRTVENPVAKVAFYVSCTKNLIYPEAAKATYRILVENDVQVIFPEQAGCCGLPPHSAGDLEGARALARQNMHTLLGYDVDYILVDEGTCTSFLHEYAFLFKGEPEEEQARALQEKVVDLTVFLTKIKLKEMGPINAKVTWHDPCHLKHYLHISEEPRQVLKLIPGLQFVEARDADMCCGGAGSYMIKQYELSQQILTEKMKGMAETQADYIVTSSPSCIMQLNRGVRDQQLPSKVLYLSQLLEMAYDARNAQAVTEGS